MLDAWLVAAGGLVLVVAAFSGVLPRLPITEPMIGLLVGVALGPAGLGLLELPVPEQEHILHLAARITLAIALVAIALRYPVGEMTRRWRPVLVLLVVVMPAMAALTALVGTWTLGMSVPVAAVLGACLAPTDPVLASSVVTGEPAKRSLPARLRVTLSMESGINDGLALPMVLVAASAVGASLQQHLWLEAAWKVVGALLVGVLLGLLAARLLRHAERHSEIARSQELLYSVVLATATLGAAGAARTDGLLAVFAAGLAFNAATPEREREQEVEIDEGVNQVLVLPLFVLFGAALPWDGFARLGWAGAAFVLGVLLLRRLPAVALLGRAVGARGAPDVVWLGWFGPVGVAAIYYLTHLSSLGVDDPVVWHAGALAVTASIVAHGLTAAPGRRAYARAVERREARQQAS